MGVYLTDLADACRSSGLPVVEEAGWRSRGHGPLLGRPRAVVVHHTAGPKTGEAPSLRVVRDGRSDLLGPLAQLVLGRSGTVYVVAAGLAYHAGAVASPDTQGNGWSIGIEAEHDGVSQWPAAQYDAYARLCAALCRWYGLGPDRVLGHKEVAVPPGRKSDPNFDCRYFRMEVAALLNGGTDMALTSQQAEQLARVDATLRFGESGVRPAGEIALTLYRIEQKLDQLLARGGGELAPANVDVDAVAERVADVLAARLAA